MEGKQHIAGEVGALLRDLWGRKRPKSLPGKLLRSGPLLRHNSNTLQIWQYAELCNKIL